MALFGIFLNILQWNHPKFSQHIVSSGKGILKTKKVGFVKALFLILQIFVLPPQKEKNWFVDFPEKQGATRAKYLLPVCQILGNFPKGNKRIFTVSFAFCAHVDVKNIDQH